MSNRTSIFVVILLIAGMVGGMFYSFSNAGQEFGMATGLALVASCAIGLMLWTWRTNFLKN